MSNYTKSTNFATKDNLTPGDPLKIVRGTEIDTEFNNIATAVATKTDNSAAAITGGTITGITDLAVADGGTGASTAAGGLNNLLPTQTGNANKYLQTDGTNATWDAVTLSTADITGTLAVANGGTGVTSSTGTGSVVLSNSPTLVTPALGTPASGTLTNATGLPISTGVSGLGTGVATFLGTPSSANLISAVTDETGTGSLVFATSPTLVTPALGTPSALVGTNITGTASGLTAGNVTTNANLTGAVTSVGNATSLGSFTSSQLAGALTDETGTGSAVFATSPTLVTPILGTPTSATLTNATGLPISTGVSGLGTGVATALAVNTGSAGAPVLFNGALGTPTSGTVTNLTGTASININGTVGATTASSGAFTTVTASTAIGTTSGGTGLSSFTSGGVVYASSTSALATGVALSFDSTNTRLGIGTNAPVATLQANKADGGYVFGLSGTTKGLRVATDATQTSIQGVDNTLGVSFQPLQIGGSYLSFAYSGTTEGMRLTSTGLGIGTSSPAVPLEVAGSVRFARSGVATQYISFIEDSVSNRITSEGASKVLQITNNNTTSGGINFDNTVPSSYIFNQGGTEFMRLTGTGNLGIGTSSPGVKLDVTGAIRATAGLTLNTAPEFNLNNGTTNTRIYMNSGDANIYFRNITTSTQIGVFNVNGIGLGTAAASSGIGLAFPATQSASSDANTLDDYEEGSWTPTAFGATTAGTTTYTVQSGSYIKIGRKVFCTLECTWTAQTGTGALKVGGLPFTASATISNGVFIVFSGSVTPATASAATVQAGLTTLFFYTFTGGTAGQTYAQFSYDV